MALDLKRRVIEARAEASYALAEVQLESGDAEAAAAGFAGQARDLRRRKMSPGLERRGWFGVLGCVLRCGARCPALGEAIAALGDVAPHELTPEQGHYGRYRPIVSRLLEDSAWDVAHGLAQVLTRWFPGDPRPAYAAARALDAQVVRGADQDTLLRALDVYDVALAAANHVGARRQWDAVLRIRKAALWLRYGAHRAEACTSALRAVEDIDHHQVRRMSEPYRLIVAHAWLHAPSSIRRLRGLDLLEASCRPATHEQVARILDDYLRSLDWRYYPTEHDRATALAEATNAPRRTRAHLELIAAMHGVIGRRAAATVAHLEQLADATAADSDAARRYYELALHLAREGEDGRLGRALPPGEVQPDPLLTGRTDALALATAACRLRCQPERSAALRLVRAAVDSSMQTPHGQAAWAVAVPALLDHWLAWSEIRGDMVEALRAYLEVAAAPSFGFGPLAARLAHLDEFDLAAAALHRGEAAGEPGTPGVRERLAAHSLERGDLAGATRWLLPTMDHGAVEVAHQ